MLKFYLSHCYSVAEDSWIGLLIIVMMMMMIMLIITTVTEKICSLSDVLYLMLQFSQQAREIILKIPILQMKTLELG